MIAPTADAPHDPDPAGSQLESTLHHTRFPNYHCRCVLEVAGPQLALRDFRRRAETPPAVLPELRAHPDQLTMFCEAPHVRPLHLGALVPIPASIIRAGGSRLDGWRVDHWGAKELRTSSITRSERAGRLTYSFVALAAPPIPWLGRVARKHQALLLALAYEWWPGRIDHAVYDSGHRVDDDDERALRVDHAHLLTAMQAP